MGIVSGSRIVEDGLVFHYDMENTSKSFRGKPVTNLVASGQRTCSSGLQRMSAHVQSWTYSVNQQYAGRKDTIRMYINPTTSNPYSDFGFQVSKSGGSAIGDVYWVSFEYKTVKGNGDPSGVTTYANGYKNPDSSSAHTLSNVSVTTLPDGWKRWSGKATITQAGNTWWRFGQSSNSFETETYLDNFQIILSDTDAPFVDGTRSNTEAIVDLTGNQTITPFSLSYLSDNTFTMPSGGYVTLSDDSPTIFGTGSISATLEMWCKPTVTHNKVFCGQQNTSGQRLYIGALNNLWDMGWGGTAWDSGVYTGTRPSCVANVWQHIVLSIDNGVASIYKNGVFGASKTDTSVTMTGTFPIGSYFSGGVKDGGYDSNKDISNFKIYDRALSADEVLNNFEASRSRYGI